MKTRREPTLKTNESEAADSRRYLVASDFDKTLSFNDSGLVLSEILGVPGFEEKVEGLSRTHLVQQGAELAYLLRHDPAFRGVRREHLVEAGKKVRLRAYRARHGQHIPSAMLVHDPFPSFGLAGSGTHTVPRSRRKLPPSTASMFESP